jgi:hypothetical protein
VVYFRPLTFRTLNPFSVGFHHTATGSGGLPVFPFAGETPPMRPKTLTLLCLATLFFSGCKTFDPESKYNPNRGEYHDEGDLVGKEGRGDQEIDQAPDKMGSWLYSPKARAISRNLGVED